MIKINSTNYIIIILLISAIARLFAALYFADKDLVNEWAVLVHNLDFSGTLGYHVISSQLNIIPKFAEPGETVLPSVFMPPLYAYFIYSIKVLSPNFVNYVTLIIAIQIIISLISIYIFYKILKNFYSINTTLISTVVFSLIPLNIYSSVQVSSISLQIFLLVFYFYFVFNFSETNKIKHLIFFSIFSGLLILIRGEFILFYIFTLIYFLIFLKKNIKALIISLIISTIIISPYLKRNYENFDKYFILTKSFGYNLLKGNNPETRVEGYVNLKKLNFKKDFLIEPNNHYEINLDNFYKDEAFKFIKLEPIRYVKLYFLKVFSFVLIDFNSSYPNYYNLAHILPKLMLSIFSIIGAVTLINRRSIFQYLSFYYLLNIFLFSFFFILPRYSMILLPIQILLSIEALKYLIILLVLYFCFQLG